MEEATLGNIAGYEINYKMLPLDEHQSRPIHISIGGHKNDPKSLLVANLIEVAVTSKYRGQSTLRYDSVIFQNVIPPRQNDWMDAVSLEGVRHVVQELSVVLPDTLSYHRLKEKIKQIKNSSMETLSRS